MTLKDTLRTFILQPMYRIGMSKRQTNNKSQPVKMAGIAIVLTIASTIGVKVAFGAGEQTKLIDTATNEVYSTRGLAELDMLEEVNTIMETQARAQNDNFILLQHEDLSVTLYSIGYAYEDCTVNSDGLPNELTPISGYANTGALLGANGVSDVLDKFAEYN